MNESSNKEIINKYKLIDDDLYYRTGTRLTLRGFIKLKKDNQYTTYKIQQRLTPKQLLQLSHSCKFPYFLTNNMKTVHIFGETTNVIIRLKGDDIIKWLDSYVPSKYNK